ncbi:hypothetical protein OEZ85_009903 [Tetradesmus obliquus]|uniref:Uncharacterized protein n=1 Tax=Tetradesmus obliquus TaxID=3088 RepID=A0ABY8UAF1_TETOB|nr:hypothetical protein OEZ85_009903 [Tetradesmus obliquus]
MLAYELGFRLAAKLHPGGVYPAAAAGAGAALTAVALVVPLAQAAADNRQLEEVDGLQKAAAAHCSSGVSAMIGTGRQDDDSSSSSSSSSQSGVSSSTASSRFTDNQQQ